MTTLPSWLRAEERQCARTPLHQALTLSGVVPPALEVELVDISALGCRLRVSKPVSVGTFVSLGLADVATCTGWVAWQKGAEIGIDFSTPLQDEILALRSITSLGLANRIRTMPALTTSRSDQRRRMAEPAGADRELSTLPRTFTIIVGIR